MKRLVLMMFMVVLSMLSIKAQDTLQTTPYSALPAAVITSWQTQLDVKDSTWIDTFMNNLLTTGGYITDYTVTEADVTQHQTALSIPVSQIPDFDTEVSNNTTVVANTGKDTTGIYHANRSILDNTTASFTTTLSGNISTNNAKISFPGFTNLATDYGFTDNSTNWNSAYTWVNTNGANAVTAYTWGDWSTNMPSATMTFTNKSGSNLQWTNDAGYITGYTETQGLEEILTVDNVSTLGATFGSTVAIPELQLNGNWLLQSEAEAGVERLTIKGVGVNSAAELFLHPTGSATTSRITVSDNVNTTNYEGLTFQSSTTENSIQSIKEGTGTAQAIKFKIDGSEAVSINTDLSSTFSGSISATNLSGTNTGDQDISGISVNADSIAVHRTDINQNVSDIATNQQAIIDTASQIRTDIPDLSVILDNYYPIYTTANGLEDGRIRDFSNYTYFEDFSGDFGLKIRSKLDSIPSLELLSGATNGGFKIRLNKTVSPYEAQYVLDLTNVGNHAFYDADLAGGISELFRIDGAGNIIAQGKATAGADATANEDLVRLGQLSIDNWNNTYDSIPVLRADIPTTLTELDSAGFQITESQISDLDHFTNADETDPNALLTAGTDNVKDTHIDWGTGANQVSTADIPEQTNLFYTEARVSANSDVTANTAKVSYPGSADATELNILDGATLSTTELNYVDGVTSSIQAQLGSKVDTIDVQTATVYTTTQVDSIIAVLRSEMGGGGITGADSTVYDVTNHIIIAYSGAVSDTFLTDGTASFSTEYQAVYNAFTTPPSTDTAIHQSTLVDELKTAGVWAEADVLYVAANNNEANALINWISPGTNNMTNSGSATFTVYEGFTGNGTSMQLTTNYNPTTDATNYTQNDATLSAYIRNDLESQDGVVVGVGGNYAYMIPQTTFNEIATRFNSTNSSVTYTDDGSSQGLSTIVRTSSTNVNFYDNGSLLGSGTQTSTGLPNADFYVLSRGSLGYSPYQVSFIYVGGALTGTQVADMNTAVEKYMDAIGKGVQP